ncbi:MAG: phosphohistidine phosphatase SixA [Nitrososphaera sp.]
MVQLYILRHGEAGKGVLAGGNDSKRALTAAGEEEVQEIAQALSALGLKLDFMASSPLERARQTAQLVAKALKVKKGSLEEWDELKPEGRRADLYKRLAQFKPETSVMVVGHEPYLSTVVGELVFGSAIGGRVILKKAGLAKVAVTSFQPKVKGELRWLLAPRHMKRMAR